MWDDGVVPARSASAFTRASPLDEKSGPAEPVKFVAFVNEEPPYFWTEDMGSLRYARAARARGDNIVAMLSLETIGYYSDSVGSQRYPAILDMNGTRDEAIPPKTVDAHREAMEPYARKYRVARVEGFTHYLFRQEQIKVVGTLPGKARRVPAFDSPASVLPS